MDLVRVWDENTSIPFQAHLISLAKEVTGNQVGVTLDGPSSAQGWFAHLKSQDQGPINAVDFTTAIISMYLILYNGNFSNLQDDHAWFY